MRLGAHPAPARRPAAISPIVRYICNTNLTVKLYMYMLSSCLRVGCGVPRCTCPSRSELVCDVSLSRVDGDGSRPHQLKIIAA